MSKHTHGPWTSRKLSYGIEIVDIAWIGFGSGKTREEHEANGALIEEAPGLLESLEIAMEYLVHVEGDWATKARERIAKAKGGKP